MARRLLRFAIVSCLVSALIVSPCTAFASTIDDIGQGLVTVTGLRGVIRGIASGAGEGVRDQLNKFVDEKVDPLIDRVDKVLQDRIEQATQSALATVTALESAMNSIIDRAANRVEDLNAQFFADLNQTLDMTFSRLETLLDSTLCKIMPDGRVEVSLGPFKGNDKINVRRPRRTQCYSRFLAAQDDPKSATFRRWEYFVGELCEYELRLNRIEPSDTNSISDIIAGYDKLSEMANTARCAAPTPSAKVEMVQKLYSYQFRAEFFRQLQKGGRP